MARGDAVRAILEAFREHGPMTRADLCLRIDMPAPKAATLLQGLMRATKRPVARRRVRISGWTFEHADDLRYPRAIYRLGWRPDVPKPSAEELRRATVERYRARKRGYSGRRRLAFLDGIPNSVFVVADSLR